MTIEETSKTYGIPLCVLQEYERWGLCGEAKTGTDAWQYDQTDIERLSLIVTLQDVGFTTEEIAQYMRLYLSPKDTVKERSEMLRKKRDGTLDEIHFKQKQLDRLDYLRFETAKGKK